MRSPNWFAAGLLVAASLACVHVTAQAQPARSHSQGDALVLAQRGPDVSPKIETETVKGLGLPQEMPESELSDYRAYARQTGEPLEEIIERQTGSAVFGELVYSLEADDETTFVSAGMAPKNESQFDVWIQFTARPSPKVFEELQNLPIDTEVRYGSSLSAKRQQLGSGAVLDEFTRWPEVILPASGSAGFDEDHHGILATYSRQIGATDAEVADALAAARASGREAAGVSDLAIAFVEEDAVVPTSDLETVIKGGHWLWNNGEATCTAGFTARRTSNNHLGVITAQHCPNNMNYEGGVNDELDYEFSFAYEDNNYIDAQFHDTQAGHLTANKFFAGDGEEKTVTGLHTALEDSIYCHYGLSSPQRRCDEIQLTYWCHSTFVAELGYARNLCGLARTKINVSGYSDSGGPWFKGGLATGTHSGGNDIGCTCSYFTMIHKVGNNGLVILQ